jgi:hypothetical protein
LCSLERVGTLVVKKKDMELDEIKYLYLLFIPLVVLFFQFLLKVKKAARIWDLELIKKLSPTVLFLNLFKLVVILLFWIDFDWSIQKLEKWRR